MGSLLNQITHTKYLLTVTVNKKDTSKKIGIFLSPEKLKILKYLSQTTGLMMPKLMILKMLNLKVGMIFQNKLMTQKLRNQKIGMMKPMVNGSLQGLIILNTKVNGKLKELITQTTKVHGFIQKLIILISLKMMNFTCTKVSDLLELIFGKSKLVLSLTIFSWETLLKRLRNL